MSSVKAVPAHQATEEEDVLYQGKYEDVKKQVTELEDITDELQVKLQKAKRNIDRLKLERKILLEKLENLKPDNADISDADSGHEEETDVEEAPKKKRKTKKKDPNAPKRPANPFFLYAQMKRDDIKSQNPEIARAELARTLAANWKALSEDDKKEYYDLYEKRKETWASEMADYEEAKEEAAGTKAETSGNQEQDHANVESDIMNAEEEEDGV